VSRRSAVAAVRGLCAAEMGAQSVASMRVLPCAGCAVVLLEGCGDATTAQCCMAVARGAWPLTVLACGAGKAWGCRVFMPFWFGLQGHLLLQHCNVLSNLSVSGSHFLTCTSQTAALHVLACVTCQLSPSAYI
jgi:hypothetical protein